jgi:hypothetical protein
VDVSDVLIIVVVCVWFAAAARYVRLCDRVIGPDPDESLEDAPIEGSEVHR